LKRFLGGYSLTFDDFDFDVVENVFSYGNKQDKLEIMGLYTCEEMGGDSVMGHLTAKEIFEKFISIYGGL